MYKRLAKLMTSILKDVHKKARKKIFLLQVLVTYLLETNNLYKKYYFENKEPSYFIRQILENAVNKTEQIVAPIVNFLPHRSFASFSMKSRLMKLKLGKNDGIIPPIDFEILLDSIYELLKELEKNSKYINYKDIINFSKNNILQLIIYLKYLKPKK